MTDDGDRAANNRSDGRRRVSREIVIRQIRERPCTASDAARLRQDHLVSGLYQAVAEVVEVFDATPARWDENDRLASPFDSDLKCCRTGSHDPTARRVGLCYRAMRLTGHHREDHHDGSFDARMHDSQGWVQYKGAGPGFARTLMKGDLQAQTVSAVDGRPAPGADLFDPRATAHRPGAAPKEQAA
jgi:hypothetical protein